MQRKRLEKEAAGKGMLSETGKKKYKSNIVKIGIKNAGMLFGYNIPAFFKYILIINTLIVRIYNIYVRI